MNGNIIDGGQFKVGSIVTINPDTSPCNNRYGLRGLTVIEDEARLPPGLYRAVITKSDFVKTMTLNLFGKKYILKSYDLGGTYAQENI